MYKELIRKFLMSVGAKTRDVEMSGFADRTEILLAKTEDKNFKIIEIYEIKTPQKYDKENAFRQAVHEEVFSKEQILSGIYKKLHEVKNPSVRIFRSSDLRSAEEFALHHLSFDSLMDDDVLRETYDYDINKFINNKDLKFIFIKEA